MSMKKEIIEARIAKLKVNPVVNERLIKKWERKLRKTIK